MVRDESPLTSRTKKCSNKDNNLPFQNTRKYKTYGEVNDENIAIDNNSKERTLEDNKWKDSFDNLLDNASPFAKKNVLKKIVRASYNQNSSIDLTVSKDHLPNINSLKRKNKNNIPKSNKRSPFNLDKSLEAINKIKKKILKNPQTKRKIKNNNKQKYKQCDKSKGKSIASTPLREKKLQNYLQNCGISPIEPEFKIRKRLHSMNMNYEKLILNYTDSIEEARNLSESNKTKDNSNCNTNSHNFRNNIDENDQTKNDEELNKECNINVHEAGLELYDRKMKYILSYINKLPSEYDKYYIPGVSNITSNSIITKSATHLEIENSQIDDSLLRICDKICQSNPISGYNENLFQSSPIKQKLQKYNESFRIISLTPISNHDSFSNVQNLTRNHDITLHTKNRLVIDYEMGDNENILDKYTEKSNNEIGLKVGDSIQLIDNSSNSILSNKRNKKELNNKISLIAKDLGNSNKLSMEVNENYADSVRLQTNCVVKSINNIDDYLITTSQFSNKIDNQERLFQIIHGNNPEFINKLIFLQNCQILNDNIKLSKSINCLNEKKNKEIRRHTVGSLKTPRQNIIKMLNMNSIKLNKKNTHKNSQSYNTIKSILCDNVNISSDKLKLQHIPKKIPEIFMENNFIDDIDKNRDNNIRKINNKSHSYFVNENRISTTNTQNITDNVDKIGLQKKNSPHKILLNKNNNIEMISKKYITRRRRQITSSYQNNDKIIFSNANNRNSASDSLNSENNESEQNKLIGNNNNLNNKIKSNDKTILKLKKSNCKIPNKKKIQKIEKQNENLISIAISSSDDCEIILATPVKRLRGRPQLTNTASDNNLDENNIINLSKGNIRLTRHKVSEIRKTQMSKFALNNIEIKNKYKKLSVEQQQSELNQKTDKKIISTNETSTEAGKFDERYEVTPTKVIDIFKRISTPQILPPLSKIENIITNNDDIFASKKNIIDSDCEIIPGSPSVPLKRITRTRTLPTSSNVLNNSSDVDRLDSKEKTICCKLGNNNKILIEQKEISSEKKESIINHKLDNFKLKKCKIYLRKERPITYKKTIDKNINIKKCKILLERQILNNSSKILAQAKKNNSPELNNIQLTENLPTTKSNSRKTAISNITNISATSKSSVTSPPDNSSRVNSCVNISKNYLLESGCSVIELSSFEKDEFINEIMIKSKNFEKYSMPPLNTRKEITKETEKLILTSGKWRRSVINWKKNQSIIELDDTQIPVVLRKNKTISLEKTITENKYKLMPKLSSSHKQNTLISDQLIDKELKTQILPVQNIIRNNDRRTCLDSSLIILSEKPEAECKVECKISEKRQTGVRKTLLLEPTDDGTPNYTTCSLFNTFANRKAASETLFVSKRKESKNSKRFIEIEEEDFNDLQQKDDQQHHQQQQPQQYHNREEYSNDRRCISNITKNNNKPKYQHQLSVPICGTKQQQSSSIVSTQRSTRRGRSIIETSNTSGFEQLSSSSAFTGSGDYHHHSNREFIHSLLLNEDEQNILLSPSLNVSIRALLSPRDIVLRRCGQTDPYDFSTIYSEIELRQCRKIGEGVFGEVYMNKNRNGEAVVLKIIPIDGLIEINGEQQKNFEQILPEIIIAAELSRLRSDSNFMTSGFVEVKDVHCVQGRYPQHLIDLWELYRDNCGTANDHPEIFPDDQLYIVLELANGGQDLEAFQFQNALQSYSAFFQTALSLAVAENKFKFEHRDLHWGNILLAPTNEKEINFKLNEKIISIPTHGVKATIIDYTLSRMNFEGCCLYNDLSNDDELFTASGDYQFDIYRLMQKNLENQWERYDPYTNILWLHYTIDKMISGARYRSSKTKKHRSAIQDMMDLRDELLDYKSASDYVECLN